MPISRPALVRRIAAALDAAPSRIPVLLGLSGSGRSTLLRQVHERLGASAAQYIDVERTATTPERFLRAVSAASPFPSGGTPPPGARAAFDATLALFNRPRPGGSEPATFLLDEFLELRTFESFPGLRGVLGELADSLAASGNRFVLASRYSHRTLHLLRDRSARFEPIHVPQMTAEEVLDMLGPASQASPDADYTARTLAALADGRPAYVTAIADELLAMSASQGGGDTVSALTALLVPEGRLTTACEHAYELRLHRARGYGALKAILDILADEESLTLTEISQRLQRTPGSTKDYLSWLEDVDLVVFRQKRYTFADPLLRVWVRLHCRVSPPTEDDVAHEIHRYALPRLPQVEPAMAMAAAVPEAAEDAKRDWGIIEID